MLIAISDVLFYGFWITTSTIPKLVRGQRGKMVLVMDSYREFLGVYQKYRQGYLLPFAQHDIIWEKPISYKGYFHYEIQGSGHCYKQKICSSEQIFFAGATGIRGQNYLFIDPILGNPSTGASCEALPGWSRRILSWRAPHAFHRFMRNI